MSEQLNDRLSNVSTEQLKDMLRHDLLSDEYELDADTSAKIIEVISNREPEVDRSLGDADSGWKDFCENHLPKVEERIAANKLLSDQKEIKEELSDVPTPSTKTVKEERRLHKFGRLARVACVALVIGILATGTVSTVAAAAGYDIWGAVGRWTAEFFQFDTGRSDSLLEAKPIVSDLNREIYDVLKEHGIEDVFLPSWYPEGYSLQDVEASDDTEYPVIKAKYVQADSGNKILLRIGVSDKELETYYEKDPSEVVITNYNGIDHYILLNKGKRNIVWLDGTVGCVVAGQISAEDAEKIIASIYVDKEK